MRIVLKHFKRNCSNLLKSETENAVLTIHCGGYIIKYRIFLNEVTNMTVTKDSLIGDVLDYNIDTAQFFMEIGMHCLGCPHSRGESIEEACSVHGTDADELVKRINEFLASK